MKTTDGLQFVSAGAFRRLSLLGVVGLLLASLSGPAYGQFTAANTVTLLTEDGATAVVDAMAAGTNATAGGTFSTAVGNESLASAVSSTAIGHTSEASGESSTALGDLSLASGDFSTALGADAAATNTFATAVGRAASATGFNSTALGDSSFASGDDSTALGADAAATGAFSTAVGQGAFAGFDNSTAIGAGAMTTREDQIVLGTDTTTFTAPGITSDASRAAQVGPRQILTTDADGNLGSDTAGGLGLASAEDVKRNTEGVAMAMALSGVPSVLPDCSTYAVSVNGGLFEGETAVAVGGVVRLRPQVFANGGGAVSRNGTGGGRLGLTFTR